MCVLAMLGACAGSSYEPESAHSGQVTRQEKYLLDVTLIEGLEIRNVIYRKEPLGGKWLLQVKQQSGLTLSKHDGKPTSSLSEKEFAELISQLLTTIHREHNGKLDSIHVDLSLLDPLWIDLVKHLREAAIAPDYIVDPKSNTVLNVAQFFISKSALVKNVCDQVTVIERKCKKHAVSMNPLVFQPQHLRKRWGDVKHLPDAGIENESIWFSIDLEK